MSDAHESRLRSAQMALLLPVYVPTALLSLAQGLLLPTLPVFARSFGVSFGLASLALSAAAIGTLLTDVPAGMLLGRIGLRWTMVLGAGVVATATFAAGFAGVFVMLIAMRLAAGVGTSMWGLSRHAFITEEVDARQRGRVVSVFGGINRLGMFAGPVLGGLIGNQFGLRASFFAAGGLGMLALAISFAFIKETQARPKTGGKMRWGLLRETARVNRRELSAAGAAQIFGQVIRTGRQAIIPFFGEAVLGLNVAQIGTIQSASSTLDMALFMPAGFLMDRFGRKVAAVPSFAILAVGMALIPFADSYTTLLLAAIVMGCGNGLGSGTMMTLGADLAPRGATGEFLGVWRLVGDTGMAGGPLVVGSLTDALGFDLTALALSGVGVTAALTLALLVRETRLAPLPATGD